MRVALGFTAGTLGEAPASSGEQASGLPAAVGCASLLVSFWPRRSKAAGCISILAWSGRGFRPVGNAGAGATPLAGGLLPSKGGRLRGALTDPQPSTQPVPIRKSYFPWETRGAKSAIAAAQWSPGAFPPLGSVQLRSLSASACGLAPGDARVSTGKQTPAARAKTDPRPRPCSPQKGGACEVR